MNAHNVTEPIKNTEITAKAVIFTRASTNDLVRNSNSLQEQQAYCEDYAQRNGLEVVASFEAHETGRGQNRPEFFRMLDFVAQHGQAKHLLVYDYDRFSKDGMEAMQHEAQLISRGAMGVSVTSCAHAVDPDWKYGGRSMHEWKAALHSTHQPLRRRPKSSKNTSL